MGADRLVGKRFHPVIEVVEEAEEWFLISCEMDNGRASRHLVLFGDDKGGGREFPPDGFPGGASFPLLLSDSGDVSDGTRDIPFSRAAD